MATNPNTLYGNWYIQNLVAGSSLVMPAGSVGDDEVEAGANIAVTKVVHLLPLDYSQAPGTAVVAETRDLHIVRGLTGSVLGFQAAVTGALANDASRHVTIDLQKSTAAGAFATVLSAVIDLTSSSTLRTAVAATVSSASLVAGDILRVVVAVSGGSGTQAQGLAVTATISEAPT